jgi:hypothetical protein
MPISHTNENRLKLHRQINRAHAQLMKFLIEHRSVPSQPWTEAEATRHKLLLDRWSKAVLELQKFES